MTQTMIQKSKNSGNDIIAQHCEIAMELCFWIFYPFWLLEGMDSGKDVFPKSFFDFFLPMGVGGSDLTAKGSFVKRSFSTFFLFFFFFE